MCAVCLQTQPQRTCDGHHREGGTEGGPRRQGRRPSRRTSKAETYHSRQPPEQQQTEPDGGLLLSPHVPHGTEKTEATSAFFAKATVPSTSMISMESVHRTVSLWEQYTPVMIAENSQKKPETRSGEYWLPSN